MYLVGRHDGQMQPFFVKLRHDGGMELPGRALCIDERVKGPDYWWHSMAVPKTLPDLAKLPPFTPEGT